MAVDYDRAFAEVIASRWSETPDEQRNAAEFPRRQGQLAPDAPDSHALRDSVYYQRGHADVFREVYKKARHAPPRKGADTATAPIGLEYRPDLLDASQEDGLLARIDDSEWLTDLSRRVMHVGYKYDYTSRGLDETARIGPLPEWLARLSNMVREAASTEAKQLLDPDRPFEQAIINEYLPGQGIAPHIDRDCFGPLVATVSLCSAVNMDFSFDSTGDKHVQPLLPRSLVLLYGDARSKWRHGIAKRRSDTWNGQRTKRDRRVSITFRTVADTGLAQT